MTDDPVTIDLPEGLEGEHLFDPGPPPNDEAWRSFEDLFPAGSEDGAYALACDLAEKVARKDKRLGSIRSVWQAKKARLLGALEKLAERLKALEAGEQKACAEIEGQRAFQLHRLISAARTDRFAKAWGMGKRAKSVTLPTSLGPFALSWSDAPKPTWATGEDGKRDDEAIIGAVADRLAELGLFEVAAQFVETPPDKLRAGDLKKALRREGEGTFLVVVTEELTEAILEEEAAGRVRYETFTQNAEGLPVSWKVLIPAYAEDVLDGEVVRRRPLMTWEEPNVEETVKFGPAKLKTNGTVETVTEEDEQEDETDGDR